MRLPNKTTPYEDSVFIYFLDVIKLVRQNSLPVLEVYSQVSVHNKNLSDFLDALDCLYAIGCIKLTREGDIEYVEKN